MINFNVSLFQVEAAHLILLLLQDLAILGLPIVLDVLEVRDALLQPTESGKPTSGKDLLISNICQSILSSASGGVTRGRSNSSRTSVNSISELAHLKDGDYALQAISNLYTGDRKGLTACLLEVGELCDLLACSAIGQSKTVSALSICSRESSQHRM